MTSFYINLPERHRRYYAAIEAKKLGYGGISYISSLFSMSRSTIQKGMRELSLEDSEKMSFERQRKEGGGRKKNGYIS